jgi:hypothetical protein
MGVNTFVPNAQSRQGFGGTFQVVQPSNYSYQFDHVGGFAASCYPTADQCSVDTTAAVFNEAGWVAGYGGCSPPIKTSIPIFITDQIWDFGNGCLLQTHSNYPMSVGSYYTYRTRDGVDSGGHHYMVADLYWNGSWQEMSSSISYAGFCSDVANNSYCGGYVDYEVESALCATNNYQPASCPNLGNNRAIQNDGLIRTAPGSWQLWLPSLENSDDSNGTNDPYHTCWSWKYYSFLATKQSC